MLALPLLPEELEAFEPLEASEAIETARADEEADFKGIPV